MEDVAFSDWPQPVDMGAGANSWLPAYGFQTPSALLDRDDFLGNPDADYFLHGSSTPCLYLETIHEETSDDLRSDSDVSDVRGSPLGWLATDSETDSVICMDATNDTDCESDRELACPIKRRRHDPPPSHLAVDEDPFQSLSRSSSLLQFETLEKQCQETSSSSPSIYSQFSLDSLERQKPPPDSDSGGSESTLAPSKSCGSLRAWRSFDNLSKTPSSPKKDVISAENLSEDSGFGEQPKKSPKSPSFVAYDYCEAFGGVGGKFGASCQNLSAAVGDWVNIEKEEFGAKYTATSASEPDLVRGGRSTASGGVSSVPKNLDLVGRDDELKESIAAKNWDLGDFNKEMAAFKREGSYAEAMRNRVDLSDDEAGLCYKRKLPKTTIVEFDKKVLQAISESIHSINSVSIADAHLSNIYGAAPGMQSRNVASTPNLVMNQQEQERLVDLLLDDERRKSVQDLPRDMPLKRKSSLVNHSTSTSCVSDVEDRTLNESGSTKGVHFSPVVSEVNWPEDQQSTPSTAERESSLSLCSTPERDIDLLAAALLDPPRPSASRPVPESRRPPRPTLQAFPPYDEPPLPPLAYRPLGSPPARRPLSESQPDLRRPPARPSLSQSQPDVRLRRRGSQLVKRDSDGCIIKAYVDGDGVQYKHTHLDLDEPAPPTGHVARAEAQPSKPSHAVAGMEAAEVVRKEEVKQQQTKKKLGGFFSRLASFRFSTRKDEKKKKKQDGEKKTGDLLVQSQQRVATKDDYIYIPLKDPKDGKDASPLTPPPPPPGRSAAKPPLPRAPPRVVGASVKAGGAQARSHHHEPEHRRRRTIDSGEPCPRPMEPMGLIETDLDTQVTVITGGAASGNVKTRSLLNLGAEPRLGRLRDETGDGEQAARPHKSMEFLLDKQNLKVVEPPENELQKGERVMSEHQLRVQRSLQKLTVPEWYKQAQVPREGFLLKKPPSHRESRWTGTGSKTTSLSSLGSSNPSPLILSPTSGGQPFVRWSTSKLNSTASSPCASTRSSFNARQPNGSVSPSSARSSFSCRQPYLGWRSQERLDKPRTPAERLANSLLARHQDVHESPEIQTSIKEVTSAIVHYVSGLRPEGDDGQRSRSASPRGSQKLCWLESSFVGIRPLDSPQTPVTLTESQPTPPTTLRLDLQAHNDVTLLNTSTGPRPSPGSTTLEDVLDSLLGLPSSDRAPSPSLQATGSANTSPNHMSDSRRRSDGSESTPLTGNSRRVSFQSSPVLQCRYSRCARVVPASSPEAASFKNCHNCAYTYCSRACRRAHWEKHRKTCLFSRIGTLCRQVIAAIKEQKDTLHHLSTVARRGYLSHGPGAVKCFFPCPENADRFLNGDLGDLGELTYVRWPDLLPSEMGPQLYTELVEMCKTYNPDTRLVLYVSVCVVSETPASGAVKWERQLVSRCAKMRLSKDLTVAEKDQDPETLILTCNSLEKLAEDRAKELKEMSINNVQKELRMRGVSLKRQHPVIFKQLCAYANGSCEKFTPITVYPKDGATGKSFMCIIMLEADPDSLRQVESAGVKVRTVDVLCAD